MDDEASQKLIEEFRASLMAETRRHSGVESITQAVIGIRERYRGRLRSIGFGNPENRELCDKTERIILSMANREIQLALANRPVPHSMLCRTAFKSIARQRESDPNRTSGLSYLGPVVSRAPRAVSARLF
jgi:hypothetical protein